jgi:hypothetical protein
LYKSDSFTDENDVLRVFSFASKAMNVKPLTSAPLIQVLFPAVGSLSAGLQSLPKTQFQLISTGSELNCPRVVFNYSSSLLCNFSNGTSKIDVAFFPRASFADRYAQVMFEGSVRGSCSFYVEGWQFAHVGSCQIRVSIPVLALSVLTPFFAVRAGPAVYGNLIGFLPSQVNGASIIWSSNTSGIPCIAAQLSDEFHNPALMSEQSFLLSAFSFGTVIPYELFGETTARTNSGGVAHWCHVRVSVVSSLPVCLRVTGANVNWTLPTCINVSGSGLATVISLGSTGNLLNSTGPVISGPGLPKITFVVSDAAGNVAYGRAVVIRMRVVRIVATNSSSMYVCVFCCDLLMA